MILALATYSVHFIILSCLSAGLWWSINWFSRELQIAQRKEEEEEKEKLNSRVIRRGRRGTGTEGQGNDMETGSETGTETETEMGVNKIKVRPRKNKIRHGAGGRGTVKDHGAHGTGYLSSGVDATVSTSSSTEELGFTETSMHTGSSSRLASEQKVAAESHLRLGPESNDASLKRWSSSEGGELSTDSEWEKVDEGR